MLCFEQGLFWDWIEGLSRPTPVSRDDVTTWASENWTGRLNNGIIYQNGIGQSDFLWYLRTRPSVKKVRKRKFILFEFCVSEESAWLGYLQGHGWCMESRGVMAQDCVQNDVSGKWKILKRVVRH